MPGDSGTLRGWHNARGGASLREGDRFDSPLSAQFNGDGSGDRALMVGQNWPKSCHNGGEAGIRTLGTHKGTTVFETAPIDRSGTSPTER
jgi:hypothetical protein